MMTFKFAKLRISCDRAGIESKIQITDDVFKSGIFLQILFFAVAPFSLNLHPIVRLTSFIWQL